MSDRTPTPWRTLPQVPTGIFAADEAGSKVAATKGGHGFPNVAEKVARSNAAFIVKAVNAHDDLVNALTEIADNPFCDPTGASEFARAALASIKDDHNA